MSKLFTLLFLSISFVSFSQANDLRLDSAFHRMGVGEYYENGLTYYKSHLYDPEAIQFSGLVSNTGLYGLTGCHLLVDIYDSFGELVYAGSSDTVAIDIGDTDSLYFGLTKTLVYESEYDVYFHVKSDLPDDITSNDSIHYEVEISEYTISRSNGEIEDSLLIGPSTPNQYLYVGNMFEGIQYHQISRIEIPIIDTTMNLDEAIFATVFRYNPDDGLWTHMGQTDDHIVTEADLGNIVLLEMNTSAPILYGEIFMVAIGSYDSFLLATSQSEDVGTIFYYEGEDLTFDTLANPRAVTMDVHSTFGGLAENETALFQINQNQPNPFSAETSISYNLSTTENVSLLITDINGKIVQRIDKQQQKAGTHQILLNTSDWQAGTYLYTLSVGDQRLTKQMLKVR